MARYKHIPTGTIVEAEGELPPALYEPVEDKPKPAARKRRTTKEQ